MNINLKIKEMGQIYYNCGVGDEQHTSVYTDIGFNN